MKRIISMIAVSSAVVLTLSACAVGEFFDDPGDFTAATRVETSEPDLLPDFGSDTDGSSVISDSSETAETPASSLDDSSEEEEEEEEEPELPLNENGLYDQYFLNSKTYAFNQILAERHFVCDVTYFFPSEPGGEPVKQYSERNELNGRDRHIQTRLEDDGDGDKYYDKDVVYLKDESGSRNAFILNWNDLTFTFFKDAEQYQQIMMLDTNIPSTFFYGIDDLETAVYLGYKPDKKKGTTVEKFQIEDTVYTFTYDENGYLTRTDVDDGRIAKVKNFENSCPPIGISSEFTFVEPQQPEQQQ